MRTQRGPRGQFSSLYGTTTLRLGPEFPYPPGGPRYERLVFDADGQLVERPLGARHVPAVRHQQQLTLGGAEETWRAWVAAARAAG